MTSLIRQSNSMRPRGAKAANSNRKAVRFDRGNSRARVEVEAAVRHMVFPSGRHSLHSSQYRLRDAKRFALPGRVAGCHLDKRHLKGTDANWTPKSLQYSRREKTTSADGSLGAYCALDMSARLPAESIVGDPQRCANQMAAPLSSVRRGAYCRHLIV
jgi:hypothetical protein